MIVAFDGRVTGSVSGKTNALVAGPKCPQAGVGPKQICLASLQELRAGLDNEWLSLAGTLPTRSKIRQQ
jgi:hypothetical protein